MLTHGFCVEEYREKIRDFYPCDIAIIYGDVPQAVDSKALAVIPVTKLSGGMKTLLLILNEPEIIQRDLSSLILSARSNQHRYIFAGIF